MQFYRTTGAMAGLLAVNLVVMLLKIQIQTNFVFGNMLAESVFVVGILSLLLDLKVIKLGGMKKTFFYYVLLGVIALGVGAVWEILSFSSLFFPQASAHILSEWFRIAVITVSLIGIPILYISDRVARERVIHGIKATNSKGLVINFVFCFAYTMAVLWFLFTLKLLIL